jgi:hypothetical protein
MSPFAKIGGVVKIQFRIKLKGSDATNVTTRVRYLWAKSQQTDALAAWSSRKVSAYGVEGREVESRRGIPRVVALKEEFLNCSS